MNKKLILIFVGAIALIVIFLPQITVGINSLKPPYAQIDISTNWDTYYLGDFVYVTVKNNGNLPVHFANPTGAMKISSIESGKPFPSPNLITANEIIFDPGQEFTRKLKVDQNAGLIEFGIYEIKISWTIEGSKEIQNSYHQFQILK